MLAELVPGIDADATRILRAPNAARALGGIDVKGLSNVTVAELQAVLLDKPFAQVIDEYRYQANDSETCFLYRVPDALTQSLARLPAAQREAIADRWAKCETMAMDDWGNDIYDLLGAMADLAARAAATGQALFLRIGL